MTSRLTYSSQLQFIYARLFPAYVGHAARVNEWSSVLCPPGHATQDRHKDGAGIDVSASSGATCPGGRWLNLFRWTDPIGGPVLAWPGDADGPETKNDRADAKSAHARNEGVDVGGGERCAFAGRPVRA